MKQSEALQILAGEIATCTKCTELHAMRVELDYKTVPGEGNPNADVLLIGEAPGIEEAKSGSPFVGKAGKLFDKIIEAAGWKRESLFICNILKCKPPNNRVPEVFEAANCRPFLDLQIKIVNPKWILCLGKTASIYLLGKAEPVTMGSLRGEHEYQGRRVICTYHPSYLLRTPSAKKDVWDDIQPMICSLQKLESS